MNGKCAIKKLRDNKGIPGFSSGYFRHRTPSFSFEIVAGLLRRYDPQQQGEPAIVEV